MKGRDTPGLIGEIIERWSKDAAAAGPPASLWQTPFNEDPISDLVQQVDSGLAKPIWADDQVPHAGLILYAPDEWESQFLGFGTARLKGPWLIGGHPARQAATRTMAQAALKLAGQEGRRLVSIKSCHDPAVLQGLGQAGFFLAENNTAMEMILSQQVYLNHAPDSLPTNFEIVDYLKNVNYLNLTPEFLAADLGDFFYDGHHRHDPSLGPLVARKMWEQILINDLRGRAQLVFILWDIERKQAAGLATALIYNRQASLSILAVKPQYRGLGLAKPLMCHMIKTAAAQARCFRLETSAYNLPALNLYWQLGFYPVAPLAVLHAWVS